MLHVRTRKWPRALSEKKEEERWPKAKEKAKKRKKRERGRRPKKNESTKCLSMPKA